MDSVAHRSTLVLLAVGSYLAVTIALVVVHRSGTGVALGHLYYLPIALLALVAGPLLGAGAGVLAALLYTGGVVVNSHLSSDGQILQTTIRLVTFAGVGVLIGCFSRRNRMLVVELSQLANRDSVTGLPNTRAFQAAIEGRLELDEPFVLLVGDVDELRRLNVAGREHGDDALRRLADRMVTAKRAEDDIARVGGDEFAILAALDGDEGRTLAVTIEQHLNSGGDSVTFGWATFPQDGENALALYRAADERLYARKVARGFRRGTGPESLPEPA